MNSPHTRSRFETDGNQSNNYNSLQLQPYITALELKHLLRINALDSLYAKFIQIPPVSDSGSLDTYFENLPSLPYKAALNAYEQDRFVKINQKHQNWGPSLQFENKFIITDSDNSFHSKLGLIGNTLEVTNDVHKVHDYVCITVSKRRYVRSIIFTHAAARMVAYALNWFRVYGKITFRKCLCTHLSY